MTEPVAVILNPASGRGRGARMREAVRAAFGKVGVVDVRETKVTGDEAILVRRALDDGATTIVAVGGDGTWSNVADALLRSGADARLGLVATGTGNDFAKNVGVPADDLDAMATLAVNGEDRRVDVGRIENRHFINCVGFGFDVAVIEASTRVTWLSGDALYAYTALWQLFGYEGIDVSVGGGGAALGKRHMMVIVANGQRFGGLFRIAPDASWDDGKLDVVEIGDTHALGRLRLFVAALGGRHVRSPVVRVQQLASCDLSFAEVPAYEVDGEYRQASSRELEIRCIPRALRVVGARA